MKPFGKSDSEPPLENDSDLEDLEALLGPREEQEHNEDSSEDDDLELLLGNRVEESPPMSTASLNYKAKLYEVVSLLPPSQLLVLASQTLVGVKAGDLESISFLEHIVETLKKRTL